jgi:hypothetical protein
VYEEFDDEQTMYSTIIDLNLQQYDIDVGQFVYNMFRFFRSPYEGINRDAFVEFLNSVYPLRHVPNFCNLIYSTNNYLILKYQIPITNKMCTQERMYSKLNSLSSTNHTENFLIDGIHLIENPSALYRELLKITGSYDIQYIIAALTVYGDMLDQQSLSDLKIMFNKHRSYFFENRDVLTTFAKLNPDFDWNQFIKDHANYNHDWTEMILEITQMKLSDENIVNLIGCIFPPVLGVLTFMPVYYELSVIMDMLNKLNNPILDKHIDKALEIAHKHFVKYYCNVDPDRFFCYESWLNDIGGISNHPMISETKCNFEQIKESKIKTYTQNSNNLFVSFRDYNRQMHQNKTDNDDSGWW